MTMDAMTSGFGIGKNISLESVFNEMGGPPKRRCGAYRRPAVTTAC